MFLNYLFLHTRFNNFARQSEWMSNAYLKCKDTKSRAIYYQYIDCRGSMALKMLSFEKSISSFFGWVKSFIPSTIAFNARKQLGYQLQSANQLFINFSANFYNNKQERKNDNDSTNNKYEKRQDKVFKPDMKNQLSNKLANDAPNIKKMGMWR